MDEALRSVDVKVPRGCYDVFTDYTPIELDGDRRSYVVGRLAPAGTFVAPRGRTKKPARAKSSSSTAPDLAEMIGNRTPASVAKLDLRQRDPNLPSLEQLDLFQLPLATLPDAVGGLRKLKHLRLDDTKIAELPRALWTLDLTELRLSGLGITALPTEIGNLARLAAQAVTSTRLEGSRRARCVSSGTADLPRAGSGLT